MAILVFMVGSTLPAMSSSIPRLALAQPTPINADPTLDQQIIDHPPTFTSAQESQAKAIALADSKVLQIINGRSYTFDGVGFSGYTNQTPVVWDPVVHIILPGGGSIAATVSLAGDKVTDIQSAEGLRSSVPPQIHQNSSVSPLSIPSGHEAYSLDWYKGSTNPVELYESNQVGAPSYDPSKASADGQVSWLLNAVEYNPSGDLCTTSNVYNGYFAQVGFNYPVTGNAVVSYGDTINGCHPTNIGLNYVPGDYYTFRIHAYSNPTEWEMFAKDMNTNQEVGSGLRTGMHWYLIQGSDSDSSVWLENYNSANYNTWNLRFSADNQGWADYYDGTSYHNWPGDQQVDDHYIIQNQVCTYQGYSYPHSSPPQVMSGSLANGGIVDWSNYNMAHYFNSAC